MVYTIGPLIYFAEFTRRSLWESLAFNEVASCQLKNLSKLTRKHLCQILVFNKVSSWKISQNSQENTRVWVSILIKLRAEKIRKIHKKAPVSQSFSWKSCRLKAQHKYRWYTFIFYSTAYNKVKVFCTIYAVGSYS